MASSAAALKPVRSALSSQRTRPLSSAAASSGSRGTKVWTSTPGGPRKVRSRRPSSGIAAQRLSAVCREPTSTALAGTRPSLA